VNQASPVVQRQTTSGSSRYEEISRIAAPESNYPNRPDDAAFAQTVGGCQERIFRLALRITRNHADAEDAQQEALLKAHLNLRHFEGRAMLTTWISRIAINESLMSLRKRRDAFRVPLDDVIQQSESATVSDRLQSPIEDPESAYARRELSQMVSSAVARLAPRLRAVFLLRTIEELSTTETAMTLHISTSAVKTRLRRARHDLKDILRLTRRVQVREGAAAQLPMLCSARPAQTRWVT
jgi:RNA polymerase sigma-70 factor (ECF subfamily)